MSATQSPSVSFSHTSMPIAVRPKSFPVPLWFTFTILRVVETVVAVKLYSILFQPFSAVAFDELTSSIVNGPATTVPSPIPSVPFSKILIAGFVKPAPGSTILLT